jgi:Glycosyl hydrolases family 25
MTIHFHDTSHYQTNYQPDGPTIAKATEGTGYTDSAYTTTRQRTLAGGWPFLGYHFLRHGNVPAQVSHAVAVVGKGQPLMLDVETATDGTFPTLAEMFAFMDAWPGVVSLCYIPKWFWAAKWGSPNLTSLVDRGAGLISSRYTTYSDSGLGWDPYGGVTPIIWQYTSTPIDTNAFKGTEAELGHLFAHGTAAGGDDMTPEQAAQLSACQTILDGLARGLDEVWITTAPYPDKDGKLSLAPFWDKLATEVIDRLPAGGGSKGATITLTFPQTEITGTATS